MTALPMPIRVAWLRGTRKPPSQNLRHLRGRRRVRHNKALAAAKVVREIESFCNMFRVGEGARA
jgi:hypothetical protein